MITYNRNNITLLYKRNNIKISEGISMRIKSTFIMPITSIF